MKFDTPFFTFFIFAENISKYVRVLVSSTDRLVDFRSRVSLMFKKKVLSCCSVYNLQFTKSIVLFSKCTSEHLCRFKQFTLKNRTQRVAEKVLSSRSVPKENNSALWHFFFFFCYQILLCISAFKAEFTHNWARQEEKIINLRRTQKSASIYFQVISFDSIILILTFVTCKLATEDYRA